MGLYKDLDENIAEVDVIIVGGGTAGCVVAGRLAAADPSLSILVIEGGSNNYENPLVVTPAMFRSHLAPGSTTALFWKAKKSDSIAGREIVVPSGGILGGGSSINFMMYTRAQRDDYDSWKTPGWMTDELYPFLKKLETVHGPGDEKYHGFNGPVQVSSGSMRLKRVEDDILRAAAQLGWPESPDLQTLDINNAFSRWLRYVSPEGKRSDTAHMYLHPRLQDGKHPNLHVLVESQVVRVLFGEDKRACGVEYRPNPLFGPPNTPMPSRKRTIRARKLVVVSSGSCSTPLILERSGLGRPDVLEKAGVPLLEDLPGVGHNYQDHSAGMYAFKTSLKPHETLDELLSGRFSFEEAAKKNDPRLGWNGVDIAGKLTLNEEEAASLGPRFKAAWDRDYKGKPNKPVMLMAFLNGYFGPPFAVGAAQYMTVGCYTAYSYSRGHIHITGPEVDNPPDFTAGYFADAGELDLKKQMWAYKRSREIMRRTSMYRGEVTVAHPPFPADSKAACITLDAEQDTTALKDIEYSPEDDRILEQFIRENVQSVWHALGTAKMAPREKLGVVDKDLNVYGVKGLKLADLSIAPENVGANTNNTAIVIGEKAADIIMRELGLRPPT
ncbi:GMC oxidoreductase [Xylaria sp. FL0043]|nr:GMC oxidoreductase [Xylaria sp. FL0043]